MHIDTAFSNALMEENKVIAEEELKTSRRLRGDFARLGYKRVTSSGKVLLWAKSIGVLEGLHWTRMSHHRVGMPVPVKGPFTKNKERSHTEF